MNKLITVEEHYSSKLILERIRNMFEGRGDSTLPPMPRPAGEEAPGVTDLGEGRIAYMDAHGIDAQVISLAGGVPAALEPEISVKLCSMVNDEMAEKAARYPGRLYIFANLPLGDGKAAAAELERCVKEHGFVGAMISGHYHDLPYDDEHYFPIFEKAQELDVPIYLHPGIVDPKITAKYYKGNWPDEAATLLAGFGMGWHFFISFQQRFQSCWVQSTHWLR